MKIARSFEVGKFEVPINQDEAIRWYNKAALNGNPHAAYKIYQYTKNKGGKTEEMGLAWLEVASKQNHVDAVYEVGMLNFKGLTMSNEELVEARNYFIKANKLGHPEAKHRINEITKELRKRDSSKKWNDFWAPFKAE